MSYSKRIEHNLGAEAALWQGGLDRAKPRRRTGHRGAPRKVDANQPQIVAELRQAGCSVTDLHTVGAGCPDIAGRMARASGRDSHGRGCATSNEEDTMTDLTEAEALWSDTTGRLSWRCYPLCDYTEAQARSAYRARLEAEPRYILQRDGMWWAGPVEVKR